MNLHFSHVCIYLILIFSHTGVTTAISTSDENVVSSTVSSSSEDTSPPQTQALTALQGLVSNVTTISSSSLSPGDRNNAMRLLIATLASLNRPQPQISHIGGHSSGLEDALSVMEGLSRNLLHGTPTVSNDQSSSSNRTASPVKIIVTSSHVKEDKPYIKNVETTR